MGGKVAHRKLCKNEKNYYSGLSHQSSMPRATCCLEAESMLLILKHM